MNIILNFHKCTACIVSFLSSITNIPGYNMNAVHFDDILDMLKSTRVTFYCQIGQYTIRTSARSSSRNLSPTFSNATNYCLLDISRL